MCIVPVMVFFVVYFIINFRALKIYYSNSQITNEENSIRANLLIFKLPRKLIIFINNIYPCNYEVKDSDLLDLKLYSGNKKLLNSSMIKNDVFELDALTFDPNNVKGLYAKTKSEAAKYVMKLVKNKNLNACIIHPSGIIGPNDYGNSHLTWLVKEVLNDKLLVSVSGGYDFVDVRDVADGIISACERGIKGECYILSNKYITIKQLTDLICDVQERKRIKLVLPIWIAKLVAPLFEIYYNIKKQTPLFTRYSLYTLSSNANFSNRKAKKELGFKNRNIKNTIKDTIWWIKNNQGRI